MTTPLTENPAVMDPRRYLRRPEKDALVSIEHYRHQVLRGGFWQIGQKRFSKSTIDELERMELIRRRGATSGLDTTTAGQLAIARLKGETL